MGRPLPLPPAQAMPQAKPAAAPPRADASSSVEAALRSDARSLDGETRVVMERSFGYDFGNVRVHTNAAAAQSAAAMGAAAYTTGRDIVFAHGRYAPETAAGRGLLAHELTHVLQQTDRAGTSPPGQGAMIQRSAATYVAAMNRKPEPDFALAAEHLNGESVGDIKIILKNLSAQHRVALHKAARVWPGACSNVARLTEADYLKVEPSTPKAADTCAAPAAPAKATPTAPASPAAPAPGEVRRAEPAAEPLTAIPQGCSSDLEDKAYMRCMAREAGELVRHNMEGEIYEKRLKQGVALLEAAGFGRAEGVPAVFNEGRIEGWENEAYNAEYWKVEPHPKFGGKLVLKPGKLPSAAIDDMFAHLSDWNVECGQFVQVANLYALRHSLGTTGFNQLKASDVAFELKSHASTPLLRVRMYQRAHPNGPLRLHGDAQAPARTNEEVLKELPIGGRVMWTNLQAPETSAFRNENSVKIGDDQYAAHGFVGSHKTNIFTSHGLELALAGITTQTPDPDYISTNVFISEIEEYRRPYDPKPKP